MLKNKLQSAPIKLARERLCLTSNVRRQKSKGQVEKIIKSHKLSVMRQQCHCDSLIKNNELKNYSIGRI